MKSIEVLRHEHVLVRRLLRCLGALTVEARVVGKLDRKVAKELLSLLERFVDWSHQDKEELHLFPHMLARATSEEAERLERVIAEHAQERRRLVGMFVHLEAASRGRAASVDRFVAHALMYQRLQRKHVESEEEFVLPLGEAILTEADDRRILQGFHEIDLRLGGLGSIDGRVAALCERFEVDREEAARVPELLGV